MGGDLTMESHQGEGSRLTLWLPMAAAESPTTAGGPRAEFRHERAMAAPPPSRRPAADSALAAIGLALRDDANGIVERFTEALRAKPETFANVERLSDVQLQNHVAAWLADVVQALMALESVSGDPSELIRDGSEIQRLICERHGGQRYRIGWDERAVAHEFQLLREVIEKTLTSRELLAPATGRARSMLAGFIRQADQMTRRGYHQAAQMESVAVG
jgi:hypothetical protein